MVSFRILENFYAFGIDFACEYEAKKLIRAGYSKKLANIIADRMVSQVLCTPAK